MRLLVALTAALACFLVLGAGGALAQTEVLHSIGFTKACTSPTTIGDPYSCSYIIRNVLDEAGDTLTISGLSDTVHASSGDVTANILGSVQITTTSGATCIASSGAGTAANPYVGVTSCTLPFGSRVDVLSFSQYTVQAADFGLPSHQLRDDAELTWHDLCGDPAGTGNTNCNPNPPDVFAASLTLVQQLASSTATTIHNAAHAAVTAVEVGSTVHDFVTVTGQPAKPVPTGSVTVDWFLNGTCAGTAAASSSTLGPLDASGRLDATGFAFTVNSAGQRGFIAHYLGDATYAASDGSCETLTVVDANIQLTPPTGTNPAGTDHVLTCHVNVNDSTGSVSAPAGTACTGSIQNGPGSFVGSNQCTTVGTTGDCQLTITSSVTGTTTISASTDVVVGGLTLRRQTGDIHAGDSANATKDWTPTTTTQLAALLTAVTGVGPGTSLADKVTQIQAYVAANDPSNACKALNDFLNQVKAQAGKKQITSAQAASFTAQAQAVKTTLGC